MGKADARRAPGWSLFAVLLRSRNTKHGLAGPARILAEPAYQKLLAAEPILRRAVPALTIIFLIIVAAARFMSLMTARDEIERSAELTLNLAAAHTASELASSGALASSADDALQFAESLGAIRNGTTLFVVDETFKVLSERGRDIGVFGKNLEAALADSQQLLMFGAKAGVQTVKVGKGEYLAALHFIKGGAGAVAAMQSTDAVFAEWRRNVSLNVTLFVLTSGLLLVVLYAYFSQSVRARDADEIYRQTHQRIDLALSRGRCGLLDWDMARGRMYWSRSMYEMLGYEPRDAILAFGEVEQIMHPDDGDLYTLAARLVSKDVSHIDHVFRMRHADGTWKWMRARAEIADPLARDIHLIGIAVDVTEQKDLAQNYKDADQRLRDAIENISESFAVWDHDRRLVL